MQQTGVKGGQGKGSASQTARGGKAGQYRTIDHKSASGGADELTRGNDDLINFMEQKLEQQEKNLIVKQQEYDALLFEHQNLQG